MQNNFSSYITKLFKTILYEQLIFPSKDKFHRNEIYNTFEKNKLVNITCILFKGLGPGFDSKLKHRAQYLGLLRCDELLNYIERL